MADKKTPTGSGSPEKTKVKKQPWWLLYISLLLSGILLLADAADIESLNLWTARLGIAMVVSAVALMVGNGRKVGFIAAATIWIAVLIAYII